MKIEITVRYYYGKLTIVYKNIAICFFPHRAKCDQSISKSLYTTAFNTVGLKTYNDLSTLSEEELFQESTIWCFPESIYTVQCLHRYIKEIALDPELCNQGIKRYKLQINEQTNEVKVL